MDYNPFHPWLNPNFLPQNLGCTWWNKAFRSYENYFIFINFNLMMNLIRQYI